MAINTGDGGFGIDGQTHVFDVVEPGRPGITPHPRDTGDVKVDRTVKDLSKTTKVTLGQYLSTASQANDFPVDQPSNDPAAVDASITGIDGLPQPPADSGNSRTFASGARSAGVVFDNPDLRKSTDKVTDPAVTIAFRKGRGPSSTPNGHQVLPSVQKDQVGNTLRPYMSAVLSNNRFTSDLPSGPSAATIQDPGRAYNPTFVHPRFGSVTAGRLAQVGVSLSIRASQEVNAATGGNNPSSGTTEAGALLPGFNQLGASRVETKVLEAADVLENLTGEEISDSSLTSIAPGGSWGSLNNVHDQYSGITSIGMIALSAALTASVVVVYEGLGFIVSLVKGGEKKPSRTSNEGRYILGRHTVAPESNPNAFPPDIPPDIGATLGIQPTSFPFNKALTAGVQAFFGLDNSGGLLGQVTSGLSSAAQSPGFNSIVARTIIRSALLILDSFKDVGGNPVSVVKSILNIIDTIRSSKVIGAMNVFAQLGDAVLMDQLYDDKHPAEGEPTKKSRIDSLPDSSTAVQKNRLRDSLKLAWSGNRSPVSYLIPDSALTFATAAAGAGKLGAPMLMLTGDNARVYWKLLDSNTQATGGARIPYDGDEDITVKKMEGLLEAEYMPFYLHDLRTNEIISFHAFLTNLNEDYSPSWETSEGFGRVDDVRTYRKTDRRLSLGFYMAATSGDDFNDMWVKVNKLVTMVYPQYTQGRFIADAESKNQFTMPFSQLISASPIVRLRIGDLIRSNYSRFNVARLFGFDSQLGPENKLEGESIRFAGSKGNIATFKDKVSKLKQQPAGATWELDVDGWSSAKEGGDVSLVPSLPGVSKGDKPSTAQVMKIDSGDLSFFKFKVTGKGKGDMLNVEPQQVSEDELQERWEMDSATAGVQFNRIKSVYGSDENKGRKIIGGTYAVPSKQLRPSYETLKKTFNEVFVDSSDVSVDVNAIAEFLSPQKNAVVRSFQETGGKGLAGTIDSLSFEWVDQNTWEVKQGMRAPQFFKVNLSYTPIHDISPGIDVNGFNRAPIYPVGYMAPGKDQA